MNNLSSLTLEAIGVGILTLIIGNVVFYLSTDKSKINEIKKYYTNINMTLFIIGFIIHFLLEIIGLNDWYCNKKCMIALKEISKEKLYK